MPNTSLATANSNSPSPSPMTRATLAALLRTLVMMPLPKANFQCDHRDMPSLTHNIRIHLNSARLDADLAAGIAPETSPLHAARARHLVAPRIRHASAANW